MIVDVENVLVNVLDLAEVQVHVLVEIVLRIYTRERLEDLGFGLVRVYQVDNSLFRTL